MNKQTLQAIIDNAPNERVTHYSTVTQEYFRSASTGWFYYDGNGKLIVTNDIDSISGIKSLADLRQILALTKELEEVKQELTDLLPEFNCRDAMTDKHVCSRSKSCSRCSTKLSIMRTLGITNE